MDNSSSITLVLVKRKVLISIFIIIGMLSSTLFVVILSQRSQDIRSRASESSEKEPSPKAEFTSPNGYYKVTYEKTRWIPEVKTDQVYGSRTVFNLNKEYGSARLDIMEGKSEKDLEVLKNELIQKAPTPPVKVESVEFNGKPSYLITHKETVLDSDVFYYQQIVKNNDQFFIFEKRAPNLGYNNSFLDNLLQNFSFTDSKTQVKGASNLPTDLSTVELVDLIRPSVVSIVYSYCLEIDNLQKASSYLSQPHYKFCGLQKGSGFMVNEEGIVATNGHVTKVYPEEGLVTNLLQKGNKTFSTDLIRGIYSSKGQNPTQNQIEDFYQQMNMNPQYLDRFLTEIFRMIKDKIIAVNTADEKYYVNVGNEPIQVDYQTSTVIPSSTTYTAKLVDVNYPNKYSYEAIMNKNYKRGADVAMLKIDSSASLPVLALGDVKNLREGSRIIIAGYPSLVEGSSDPRSAISYKTSTKPTITQGIVSSVKEDLTGKTILQTDASIDHGNSGGPAFDSLGEVIGIATFMAESQGGNFNFLRDISELKSLMEKNKIDNTLGNVSTVWRSGLASFRNRRYNEAIKSFKKVQKLSPNHPTALELISVSQEAIAKGESLEGLAGFIKGRESSNILLIVFGGISLTSFLSAGFLGILPLFQKKQPELA